MRRERIHAIRAVPKERLTAAPSPSEQRKSVTGGRERRQFTPNALIVGRRSEWNGAGEADDELAATLMPEPVPPALLRKAEGERPSVPWGVAIMGGALAGGRPIGSADSKGRIRG